MKSSRTITPAPAGPSRAGIQDAAKAAGKTIREYVQSELRDVIKRASVADVYFMNEVIINWNSIHAGDEMGLAAAFAEAVDGYCRSYVRVPKKLVETVKRYIKALAAGEVVDMPDLTPEAKDEKAPPAMQLPRTMRLSEDGQAQVARLVRLLRENYWLSHFVKVLLRADADKPQRVTIKTAQEVLNNEQAVDNLVANVQRCKGGWYGDHPVFEAVRDNWDDIDAYKSDEQIRKLIESAAKE